MRGRRSRNKATIAVVAMFCATSLPCGMQAYLESLEPADLHFLVGIVESPITLTNDSRLRGLAAAMDSGDDPDSRSALAAALDHEIRYLGSSDLAYAFRSLTGGEAGVPAEEIIRDVSGQLKVPYRGLGTIGDQLAHLAESYATRAFADLPPDEQQRMLEELGVERDKAAAFLKRSAGVFALPVMIEAFNVVVVQGLIKTIIFGTIARIIGRQLAAKLFAFLAGRIPWWVGWIGPAAWTLSLGWTALDLQGPASRKTVPVMLYLGLCAVRNRSERGAEE